MRENFKFSTEKKTVKYSSAGFEDKVSAKAV